MPRGKKKEVVQKQDTCCFCVDMFPVKEMEKRPFIPWEIGLTPVNKSLLCCRSCGTKNRTAAFNKRESSGVFAASDLSRWSPTEVTEFVFKMMQIAERPPVDSTGFYPGEMFFANRPVLKEELFPSIEIDSQTGEKIKKTKKDKRSWEVWRADWANITVQPPSTETSSSESRIGVAEQDPPLFPVEWSLLDLDTLPGGEALEELWCLAYQQEKAAIEIKLKTHKRRSRRKNRSRGGLKSNGERNMGTPQRKDRTDLFAENFPKKPFSNSSDDLLGMETVQSKKDISQDTNHTQKGERDLATSSVEDLQHSFNHSNSSNGAGMYDMFSFESSKELNKDSENNHGREIDSSAAFGIFDQLSSSLPLDTGLFDKSGGVGFSDGTFGGFSDDDGPAVKGPPPEIAASTQSSNQSFSDSTLERPSTSSMRPSSSSRQDIQRGAKILANVEEDMAGLSGANSSSRHEAVQDDSSRNNSSRVKFNNTPGNGGSGVSTAASGYYGDNGEGNESDDPEDEQDFGDFRLLANIDKHLFPKTIEHRRLQGRSGRLMRKRAKAYGLPVPGDIIGADAFGQKEDVTANLCGGVGESLGGPIMVSCDRGKYFFPHHGALVVTLVELARHDTKARALIRSCLPGLVKRALRTPVRAHIKSSRASMFLLCWLAPEFRAELCKEEVCAKVLESLVGEEILAATIIQLFWKRRLSRAALKLREEALLKQKIDERIKQEADAVADRQQERLTKEKDDRIAAIRLGKKYQERSVEEEDKLREHDVAEVKRLFEMKDEREKLKKEKLGLSSTTRNPFEFRQELMSLITKTRTSERWVEMKNIAYGKSCVSSINVSLIGARNLLNTDETGKSDPYVVVRRYYNEQEGEQGGSQQEGEQGSADATSNSISMASATNQLYQISKLKGKMAQALPGNEDVRSKKLRSGVQIKSDQ